MNYNDGDFNDDESIEMNYNDGDFNDDESIVMNYNDGDFNDDESIVMNYNDGDFNDDEPIVLPPDSGATSSTVPGRVQLVVRNNDAAPLNENIQKVMLELTGEEKSRAGLDLVVAIHYQWFEELKTSIQFLIKKLSCIDRLSIIHCFLNVERLCPLRQMTESTQTEVQNLINNSHFGVMNPYPTNAALKMAQNILKDRSVSSGRVGAIMLMLGDGVYNGNAAAVPVGNVAVHTFGLGNDHDAKVLKAIANNSRLGGTYSDVRKNNMTLAISQCLGGLLSVVAQDLTVTIRQIKDESTIKQVSAGSYQQSMDNVAGSVTIKFGDIYIQEIRKVLVDIHLPSTGKKKDADVLEVSYTYKFDGELFVASPATVTVCRMSGLTIEEQQALPMVRAEEVRLLIAESIEQAIDICDVDNYDLKSAQDKLVNGLLKLEDADMEKLKAELRTELEELHKLMLVKEIYEIQGRPFAYSLSISLATQRQMARGNNIGKFQLFATPAMKEFLKEAKKLLDIDDHKQISLIEENRIVLPNSDSESGMKPIVPGKAQLDLDIIINNEAPLEENTQKVFLELYNKENIDFGFDLVAVLDVSSSMEGDKLEKMKVAMLLLINNLTSDERLSIVVYSSKAKMLWPLRKISNSRTKLGSLIDDLKAQPGTNITGGLEMALNILKDRSDSSGRGGVIILMSDGEQNQGSDAADVPVDNVHVLTFGFGEDQNAEVLIAIANNSQLGGTYRDVCMENLDLTIPNCLDELQIVAVWDLMVTVTQIKNESTVEWASAGRYSQSIDNAAGSVTITLGTLYIKETCEVLVNILLPVTKKEGVANVLKVSYTYRSSFDGELCETKPAIVTVRRVSRLTAKQPQPAKAISMEAKLVIAEVIKQAIDVANKEELKSVRDKLVQCLKAYKGGLGDIDCILEPLKDELDELSKLMESQAINDKQSRSFAYSLLISQFTRPTITRTNDLTFGAPTIPAFREFVEEAKMFNNIDDLHIYMDRFLGAIESIEMIFDGL